MVCWKRTGLTSWLISDCLILAGSSAWRSPLAVEYTAARGAWNGIPARLASNGAQAWRTKSVWKAADTASTWLRTLRSFRNSWAWRMMSLAPPNTSCCCEL